MRGAVERARELPALLGIELRHEQLGDGRLVDLPHLLAQHASLLRDRHEGRAAVVGRARAGDEPLCLEAIDEAGQVVAFDGQRIGQFMHATRAFGAALDAPENVVPGIGGQLRFGQAALDLTNQPPMGPDKREPEIRLMGGHGGTPRNSIVVAILLYADTIALVAIATHIWTRRPLSRCAQSLRLAVAVWPGGPPAIYFYGAMS